MASARRAFWWFSHGGKQTLRAGACKREDTWLPLIYNSLLFSDSFCTLRGRVGEKDQSSYRLHRLISLQNPTASQECLLHWELDFILTLGGDKRHSNHSKWGNSCRGNWRIPAHLHPFCSSKPLASQPKRQDNIHGYDPARLWLHTVTPRISHHCTMSAARHMPGWSVLPACSKLVLMRIGQASLWIPIFSF